MSFFQTQPDEPSFSRQPLTDTTQLSHTFEHSLVHNRDLEDINSKNNKTYTEVVSPINHVPPHYEFTEVFVWGDDSHG